MPTPREQKVIDKLSTMTIDEARQTIANGIFGHKGSQDHDFASSWLAAKEASLRDESEDKTLSIAEEANRLASEANVFAREANSIARDEAAAASRSARWAKIAAIIAVVAAIISTTTAIIIALLNTPGG